MAETATEVKGFKNSVLGKVLFKIAAVAGLQEALDGKAAVNHSHNVSDITGMDTALKSKIQDGDNLIEISGDDTDGEIHINLMSEGDEGEGEDNDFYLDADDLNNVFHPTTTPTPGSSKLITSGGVHAALNDKAEASHNHTVGQVAGLEAILLNVEARIKRLESAVSSSLPDSAWETIEDLSFDGNQTGYKYTFEGTSDTHDVVPSVGDIVRIKGASHTYSHYGEVTAVDQAPYAITTSINLSGIQSSAAYLQILKAPTAES